MIRYNNSTFIKYAAIALLSYAISLLSHLMIAPSFIARRQIVFCDFVLFHGMALMLIVLYFTRGILISSRWKYHWLMATTLSMSIEITIRIINALLFYAYGGCKFISDITAPITGYDPIMSIYLMQLADVISVHSNGGIIINYVQYIVFVQGVLTLYYCSKIILYSSLFLLLSLKKYGTKARCISIMSGIALYPLAVGYGFIYFANSTKAPCHGDAILWKNSSLYIYLILTIGLNMFMAYKMHMHYKNNAIV